MIKNKKIESKTEKMIEREIESKTKETDLKIYELISQKQYIFLSIRKK